LQLPRPFATHRATRQSTPQSAQRTILLVEDDPFVREATCSILESAGFKVLPAPDADAALQIYEQVRGMIGRVTDRVIDVAIDLEIDRKIDLVMTDMVLPGRTGEQLAQELRRRSPNLKVLITSGYTNNDQRVDERQANTYFLAKPYSRSDLVGKIAKILEGMPLHHIAGHAV
jgi:CheY-like chemotaxis protein